MRISEICIERPVFAWVLTFILILLGVVGGSRLPLQQYPNIERSFVTIETSLPGAGPEIVESQVSRIVEEAVSGIEGVETITSVSSSEDSKVTVEFRPERDMEHGISDIRDRLAKSRDRMPDDAKDPMLTKTRADEKPVISLALTSDTIDTSELADFVEREIQKELESVAGVAKVDVVGAGKYVMNIYIDPIKMASYGLAITDVITALKRQNVEQPAGKIISKNREYLVTTIASLEKPEEFENAVIATKNHHLVRLREIGRAEVSAEDKKTKTLFNGKRGVSVSVIKQSNANPIDVARGVKKMVENMKHILPEGVTIHVGSDRTFFIEQSIKEVYKTLGEATFLVVLVVFFFLRSARASIIPLVTIPVSLIGVMFLMYLLGYSLNMFTLMALVLAIGLVVDDAIVVLENIYRYIEDGESTVNAAYKGVREISFAVIAMTLTLAAVYTPIALSKGTTGKLLTEFAITLAGAVCISGFAALTLSPMMCARLLGPSKKTAGFWIRFKSHVCTEKWLHATEEFYEKFLEQALKKRLQVVLVSIFVALLGFFIYRGLPSEFTPKEDQGSFMIEGQSPQTATLEYTERYLRQIDAILTEIPEIDRRVAQILNPTYDISVQLKANPARPTEVVMEDLRKRLQDITGVDARLKSGSGGMSGDSNIVQFVIRANKTYRELKDISQYMTSYLYMSGKVSSVTSDIRGDSQDFTVSILRDKISALNIEPKTIADSIDALIRGRKAGNFKKDNKLYEVNVEVESSARQNPEDITNLFIKAGDKEGTLVPLAELVKVNSRSGPVQINRHNRMRAILINIHLKDISLGEGITLVRDLAKEVIPQDARLDFVYDTKQYLDENYAMAFIFILSIVFIYLVMAAQFESWRDPFIILLSVPLSLAGAVITLGLLDGGSINLYSNIGLVTLIGLITKHGIMMIDFANKLREDGMELVLAIRTASKQRLRPILMTTFAMVLGALPLAFATGAGAESRRQLGWVIVGGMSIGTIFTLFVIPAYYTFLSSNKRRKNNISDGDRA